MDTLKFENKGGVSMIAHRGLSGLERENTCPAFVAAGQRSYFGIETDVQITKDGKFILCHDSNLLRVAGVDLAIKETDFDTLRSVRFTDVVNDFPRADVFLPTLEEYLHICKKYDKYPVLEIKDTFNEQQTARLVDVIKGFDMIGSMFFISFSRESCLNVKKVCPEAKIQYLSNGDADESANFCIENGFDADFHFNLITKELVDKLHAAGHLVNCWTVNTLEIAEKVKACGVDFITTNILE